MNEKMFDELIESVKKGGKIFRGEEEPSRKFVLSISEIQSIRNKHQLSQEKFAVLLGISPSTLRNWEQGRRNPNGSALVLLKIAKKHPEIFFQD